MLRFININGFIFSKVQKIGLGLGVTLNQPISVLEKSQLDNN